MLDVNSSLMLDMAGLVDIDPQEAWLPIVSVFGGESLFRTRYEQADEPNVIEFMIFDRENPSSIVSSISCARENARSGREQISSEMWEQINRTYLRIRRDSYADYQRAGGSEYLNRVKAAMHLFYGTAESAMPRSTAWNFFRLGQYLERADDMARLIEAKSVALLPNDGLVNPLADLVQWIAVLRSSSAFEAFRRSRRGQITGQRVLEYLLLDLEFPKSIRFCIVQAENALREICAGQDRRFGVAVSRALGRLRAELDFAVIDDIVELNLREFVVSLQDSIAQVGTLIEETFISYPVAKARVL
jgi:uncharacterized alpha-E superfamily protein